MKNNLDIKTWRDSELIMTLGRDKEIMDHCKKAMPILKEARLDRAVDVMMSDLECVVGRVHRMQKELERRKRGPKNMVNAFKL